MTSVLAGAYPDIFKAGIVDSGVADGCFSLPGQPEDSWNSQCSEGQLILTGAEWAQRVYDAYPGYTGARPKMQVWHGTAYVTSFRTSMLDRRTDRVAATQRHDALPPEFLRGDQAVDDRVWLPEYAHFECVRAVPAKRLLERNIRPQLPGHPRAGCWPHCAPV